MLCKTCVQLFARIARAVYMFIGFRTLHSRKFTFKSIKHLFKIQSIGKTSKVFVVWDCYDVPRLTENRRLRAIGMLQAGRQQNEVAQQFGVHRNTKFTV